MSKKKQGAAKLGKIFFSVIIIILLVGGCFSLAYFTDGFSRNIQSFFVQIGDEKIMSDSDGIAVKLGEELEVKCCYLLSDITASKDGLGYSYEIIPNVDSERDFIIQVNGSSTLFSKIKSFTDSFEVTEEKSGFKIKMNMTEMETIQKQFTEEIAVLDTSIVWGQYSYFALVVYSGDKKSSIRIPFRYIYSVTGIELSESEVIL